LHPNEVLRLAEQYFPSIGVAASAPPSARARAFTGALGALELRVKMEGGHYTVVEAHTDQVGESRLDKNVKKFFNLLHRNEDPRHTIEAGY
jgi:hypothetical protein